MLLPATKENIEKAAGIIAAGGIVAFPTETVYGLGANAKNPSAVKKIFAAKGRPATNPLIVHISDYREIAQVASLPDRGHILENLDKLKHLWPGPLSVVLPKRGDIPDEVTAGRYSVAVRIPSHPVALALIRAAKCPIAAPSANRSDYVSPTTAQHVEQDIGQNINCILDGGQCSGGLESTVISLIEKTPVLLRPGLISKESLEAILGPVHIGYSETPIGAAASPGMSNKHYSPRTKLVFESDIPSEASALRLGLIALGPTEGLLAKYKFEKITALSTSGSLEDACSKLYATLREMDTAQLDLIVVQSCAESGIGLAIMDRLKRAASK